MPRLGSLGLAYLIWMLLTEHPAWVAAQAEPIGLIGVLAASWLFALRWGLPRARRPWEAHPAAGFVLPLALHGLFLGAFGGLHLIGEWRLPAVLASWLGLLPYLVIQHAFRYGEGGLKGLDGPGAAAYAQRHSLGLLLGILPLAVVAQCAEWGTARLPEDVATWSRLEHARALAAELAGLALALPLMLALLPRLLGGRQPLPALQARVDAMWRGVGSPPRVLHWDTQGLLPNALAAGLGRWRCVLVSDALQQSLLPHELDAVLSHELAHLERRHAPALMAGVAGAGLLGVAALELLAPPPPELEILGVLPVLAFVIPIFLVASRRFEQQADLDAVARDPVHAAGLTGALSLLAGLRPWLPMRHPPAARRVAEIHAALADPARARLLQGRAERARRGLWALFVLGLAALLATT